MRTLITGATGLIGRELVRRAGTDVVVLTRHPDRAQGRLGEAQAHAWDPESGLPPPEALEDIIQVFHLAGEPVAEHRWTPEQKRRIRDSRVLGTRHLIAGLAGQKTRPRVLVSASAIGYYGDRDNEELNEDSAPGRGFLAETCIDWEREAMAAERLGIRVVCVRIGIVLARGGGALARMLTPFKMGVGGRLGSGDQWMSPIHIDDVVGILLHAAENESVRGPMNAVGPQPVTNIEFTHALGRALHRPTPLMIPRALLRIAFGDMSQVLFDSQRVYPRVAERTGYSFKHPGLGDALAAAVSPVIGQGAHGNGAAA